MSKRNLGDAIISIGESLETLHDLKQPASVELGELLKSLTPAELEKIKNITVEFGPKDPDAAAYFMLCGIVETCINKSAAHTVEQTPEGKYKHTWSWS